MSRKAQIKKNLTKGFIPLGKPAVAHLARAKQAKRVVAGKGPIEFLRDPVRNPKGLAPWKGRRKKPSIGDYTI